ncbi:class I SAM-dependent methyltransferase [Altererythrobacter aurantiacus]|uniref:Class I SAM-dependent methyltransferase n=1 Tax=Parapontixanthobacter aurantiacus TaxID=1463599 RepID=A0A844ZI57_9SPHN|nr:SAM-dependent methyltransferase [Parapontixanthobacter aurantiacus]MXO86670.1 class I SAM-dependent methyltransferase [Parapontixanthobacter aurantiacus]
MSEDDPRDLTRRFARLIRRSGPLSVSQYFGEANARYYASRDPLGGEGDFITAPEISQMFGEMIGLWCADLWQRSGSPEKIAYVELGPGRGTLARDALRVMERFGLVPDIHLVEGSPHFRKTLLENVPRATLHEGLDDLPHDRPILLIANEFFDALPIRQLVRTPKGWRERMIGLEGEKFAFVAGDQPLEAAMPESLKAAENGAILEVCPAATSWMREIADRLDTQGGAALVIDYGYDAPQFGSTLQAIRKHGKVDPLEAPGTADLTALVDFSALREAVGHNGTEKGSSDAESETKVSKRCFTTTQGAFLERLGITARANALAKADPTRAQTIAAAHRRLCSPDEMGELFKVMAVVSRWEEWADPAGFA